MFTSNTRLGIWFIKRSVGLLVLLVLVVSVVVLAERAWPSTDGCLFIWTQDGIGWFDPTTSQWSSPALAEIARTMQHRGKAVYHVPSLISPDGNYLAYYTAVGSGADVQVGLVVRRNGDGIAERREKVIRAGLPDSSKPKAPWATEPNAFQWLPDSSGIVYWWMNPSNDPAIPEDYSVAVASVDGRERAFRHFPLPHGTNLEIHNLSADGQYVAVVSDEKGYRLSIWSIQDLQPVSAPFSLPSPPSSIEWSSHGHALAFLTWNESDRPNLNLDEPGENRHQTIPFPSEGMRDGVVNWSPDGRYVDVMFYRVGMSGTDHVFRRDGSRVTTLPRVAVRVHCCASQIFPQSEWMEEHEGHTLLYVQEVPQQNGDSHYDLIAFDPEAQQSRILVRDQGRAGSF